MSWKRKIIFLKHSKTTNHHFCCTRQLHGTWTERYHRMNKRDVLILERLHISYNICFRVITATTSSQVVKVIWHKAASPPHMDGSVVFLTWRQCAPQPKMVAMATSLRTSKSVMSSSDSLTPKPTPRIKQCVASYHTTEVIAHRKAKSGCHGNVS